MQRVDRKGAPVMSSQPARGTTLTTPIRGVSPASGMAAWRRAGVVVLALASAVLVAPAWGADDAVAARERGAATMPLPRKP